MDRRHTATHPIEWRDTVVASHANAQSGRCEGILPHRSRTARLAEKEETK